jgi:glucosylceramidase
MKTLVYIALIVLISLISCKKQTIEVPVIKPFSTEGRNVAIYTTAQNSEYRLTLSGISEFKQAPPLLETEIFVFVNPNKTFQTLTGIGGAITDASAEVFAKLPSQKQEEFLSAYFDKGKGIGYTMIRTNINSCDFSSGSYTYIDEGDKELKSFSIAHDKQFKIPLIKKAIQTVGGKVFFYASPWSPPAFMKKNNSMLKGGKLLPEFNSSWATYFTMFIKAYEAEGIPVWGISLQNEPMAVQTWESCTFTAEEERDFLKNFLGPVMEKAGMGDKKIIVWDHNRDFLSQRANVILSDPEAAKYVWGVGFHWYESWSGGENMYDNVRNVYESFPDKNLIFTEGCSERFNPEHMQYWPNGERYGVAMINDFNNGMVAWTDWNILLDITGGPNHKGNFCFAPVHANTETGELIYTPSYYYIGHFSKFIKPRAKRVSTTTSRSCLLATSFLNPDGKMATIVMNQTNNPVNYKLLIGSQLVDVEILSHSIQTLVY